MSGASKLPGSGNPPLRPGRHYALMSSVRLRSMFGLLVAGYALAVIATDHLVAAGTLPLDALASSPAGLLHGRLWTMLTSGFVSAGGWHILHTLALAALLVAFAARHGGRLVLGTALVAHVGSALVAYAGLLLVTGTGLVSDHADLVAPDYGTSCVWFGCLGGLVAVELVGLLRRRPVAAALMLAAGAGAVLVSGPVAEDPLTTAEHLLALAIGAGIGAATGLRRPHAPGGGPPPPPAASGRAMSALHLPTAATNFGSPRFTLRGSKTGPLPDRFSAGSA